MRFILVNLMFVGLSFWVNGQDSLLSKNRNTILKVDLVAPAVGLLNFRYRNVFSLSAEHTFFKNQSIQLTALYGENISVSESRGYIAGTFNTYVYQVEILRKGLLFNAQYRFYPLSGNKFYIGPHLAYALISQYGKRSDNKDLDYKLNFKQHEIGIGGVLGWQFFIKNRIAIDFTLGLTRIGYIIKKNKEGKKLQYWKVLSPDGIVALNIGYRLFHNKK